MMPNDDPLEEQAERFAKMVKGRRRKFGRKLRPKEFLEMTTLFLDAERSKKNGSSLSKNPPHA